MFRFFSITLLFLAHSAAASEEAEVKQLRTVISEIVKVQTIQSEERSEWNVRKEQISALLDLHQRELKLLDETLGGAGASAPAHKEKAESLKTEIDQLAEVRRLAKDAIAKNIPRIQSIITRLPSALTKDLEAETAFLESWTPASEPRESLRNMLTVLAKADQFNRRLTRDFIIRGGREVEVLYLGLAQAFYTDKKGNSGAGFPGKDGWEWKSNPEIHDDLTDAFAVMDKKNPPELVELPLQLR